MNTPRTIVAALTLTLTAGLGALTAPAGAKQDTKSRLAAGEIIVTSKPVPGSSVPWNQVMGVVDAPGAAIWKVIERCADYKKTMIRTAASEEIWRKGGKVRCRVTVDMPFPLSDLTATTDAVHTILPGKKWKRAWSLVEGDYKSNKGSWTLVPFGADGGRTLVAYEVHADPNVPIPEGILRAAQKKTLPRLIEHLRETVR